jgi:hypothetical protein
MFKAGDAGLVSPGIKNSCPRDGRLASRRAKGNHRAQFNDGSEES